MKCAASRYCDDTTRLTCTGCGLAICGAHARYTRCGATNGPHEIARVSEPATVPLRESGNRFPKCDGCWGPAAFRFETGERACLACMFRRQAAGEVAS